VEFESFVRIWTTRYIDSLIRRYGAGWLNPAFVCKLLVGVVRSRILLSHRILGLIWNSISDLNVDQKLSQEENWVVVYLCLKFVSLCDCAHCLMPKHTSNNSQLQNGSHSKLKETHETPQKRKARKSSISCHMRSPLNSDPHNTLFSFSDSSGVESAILDPRRLPP
jgi:hypothetical protein